MKEIEKTWDIATVREVDMELNTGIAVVWGEEIVISVRVYMDPHLRRMQLYGRKSDEVRPQGIALDGMSEWFPMVNASSDFKKYII